MNIEVITGDQSDEYEDATVVPSMNGNSLEVFSVGTEEKGPTTLAIYNKWDRVYIHD